MKFFFCFFAPVAYTNIDHFDDHRKHNRKINIAFWHFLVKSLEEKHESNQNKKAEGQHFHRGVLIDEIADTSREDDHDADREHNSDDHDDDVFSETHCSEYGIE